MPDIDDEDETPALEDGDSVEVQGSSSTYTLSRQGTVYMCTCPAWKNQSAPVDARTCKHLRAYLGDGNETSRVGNVAPQRSAATIKKDKAAAEGPRVTEGPGAARSAAAGPPPILLAHKWETDHDPTGWWMSEKLDGVRAYWDGEAFVSRQGNRFFAPDWFVSDLPADTLDGELWVGRKQFSETISIVRSGAQSDAWKQVTYVVFDAPEARGGFEARLEHIEKVMTRAEAPHARWLEHVKCKGIDHLKDELAKVEALGGEGLMLRQPGSKYAIGRSNTLLKVKTFHDAEARVIDHAPGTGKHKGRLGALVVELAGGVRFNVGTGFSDAEREDPPAIGAVITFRYQELSKDGVPRFPSYVGERIDVTTPAPIGKDTAPPAAAKLVGKTAAKKPADDDDDEDESPPVAKQAAKPAAKKPPPPPPDDDDVEDEAGDDDGGIVGGDDKPPIVWTQKLLHDGENKFWEIEVRGTTHYARFGKIGSPGQIRLTDLGSATAAKSDAEKRAMQKRKEGYRIVKR